uniref:Uncharacterized protein n=1 Tax=Terrapene triunguis TaxID=2587831 RepID=A0A674JA19_9SAUR
PSHFSIQHSALPLPQSHTQNPLQVGAEIQSRFFASQGCTQSPFQARQVSLVPTTNLTDTCSVS